MSEIDKSLERVYDKAYKNGKKDGSFYTLTSLRATAEKKGMKNIPLQVIIELIKRVEND